VREVDVVFFAPWMGPLLASAPGTSAGGAETQMLMVARGLAARGLRVALVVFAQDGVPDRTDGLSVVQVPEPRARRPALRRLSRVLSIVRVVQRLRPRVLVQRIAGPETGLLALLAKVLRSRFVYSSANVVDFDYEKLGTGRLSVWLYHLGVRRADEVVVQTVEQVALCENRFGRTPAMIRSMAERAPEGPANPEAFLWVGRVDWYKHPEGYLELARSLPDARFRMIPMPMDDASRRRIEELRQEAEGLANLELLEARPRAQLAELIPTAVAMVNTSDYEGMPNVFLEGWARGVPALALSHDPDGVVSREGVGLFAEGSPERLTELARELWEGRADRVELAERCRAYVVREHSPETVLGHWEHTLGLP
jgi:glycosyltransferase involved in cell wall biosynthesis